MSVSDPRLAAPRFEWLAADRDRSLSRRHRSETRRRLARSTADDCGGCRPGLRLTGRVIARSGRPRNVIGSLLKRGRRGALDARPHQRVVSGLLLGDDLGGGLAQYGSRRDLYRCSTSRLGWRQGLQAGSTYLKGLLKRSLATASDESGARWAGAADGSTGRPASLASAAVATCAEAPERRAVRATASQMPETKAVPEETHTW
jgi:hypothetical protein